MSHPLPPSHPNGPNGQVADQISDQELVKLRAHIKGAIKFLSKTRLADNQGNTLSSLPWCILLGPHNAGKTSLLAHSEQDFILAKKSHRVNLIAPKPTQYCDWWATEQVVYADISGRFTQDLMTDSPEAEKLNSSPATPTAKLWHETVRLLKGYYNKNKHVAVIVVLSAKDLTKGKDSSLAKSISIQLNDLTKSFGVPFGKPFGEPLPLYLIINKLDELTGFNEFFYDLSQEERSQPWGFKCSGLSSVQTGEHFEQLLSKLNSQLLFRMQGQAQLAKRVAIYDFPTAMVNLKPHLLNFLAQALANNKGLTWHSVHFASGASRLPLTASLDNKTPAVVKQGKSFFIEHLLQNLVTEQLQIKKIREIRVKSWYRRGMYLVAGVCVALAATIWAYQFSKQLTNIQQIEKSIADYNALNKVHTTPTLNANIGLLDSLRQADELPYTWFLAKRVKLLQTAARNTYEMALHKLLLPELITRLEQQLHEAATSEPDRLYAALRAYLMLNDSDHRQAHLLLSALEPVWQQDPSLSTTLQQPLELHLHNLLTKPLPTLSLKTPLIAAARLRLSRLTTSELAYVIAKNQRAYSPFSVLKSSLPASQAGIYISQFFTLTSLQQFYQTELAQACQQALAGNWVLGNLAPAEPADASAKAVLQAKVSDSYLADYAHEWQRVLSELAELQLANTANLLSQLDALLAKDSAVNQALQLIDKQTQLADFTQGYSRELAERLRQQFAFFHSLLNDAESWQALQFKIRPLQIYLLQLQMNGDEQAYNAIKTHFLAPSAPNPMADLTDYAKQLPRPWQNWLTQIADTSWQLIAEHSQAYLQQLWQQQIFSFYREKMSDRFPFNSARQQEVKLVDFNAFFKPQGLLDQFFNRYLRTFIDTSNIPWQMKRLANQALAIDPQALSALQQAAIIQRMFYPNGGDKPSLSYNISPLAIDARISSLTLTIDGHKLSYPNENTSLAVTWPAESGDSQARISYQDKTGSHLLLDYKGPWSLLRFLQQGTLQTTQDPKCFILTLKSHDKLVQFELSSSEPLSPFTRDLLSNYTLPQKIS